MVVADDDRIDGRYLEVHQGILSLLARQAPVAGDLRIVAALLHVDPLHRADGRPVREHRQARAAVGLRVAQGQGHPRRDRADGPAGPLAGLAGQGGARARATSSWPRTSSARTRRSTGSTATIFKRAVEVGDDLDMREWGMFMILVARCLERVGDNTVDIAEQVVFVVTGLFREMADICDRRPTRARRQLTTPSSSAARSAGRSPRRKLWPRGQCPGRPPATNLPA